jgi:hypothetical protein
MSNENFVWTICPSCNRNHRGYCNGAFGDLEAEWSSSRESFVGQSNIATGLPTSVDLAKFFGIHYVIRS